jgi:hypothetical protein
MVITRRKDISTNKLAKTHNGKDREVILNNKNKNNLIEDIKPLEARCISRAVSCPFLYLS